MNTQITISLDWLLAWIGLGILVGFALQLWHVNRSCWWETAKLIQDPSQKFEGWVDEDGDTITCWILGSRGNFKPGSEIEVFVTNYGFNKEYHITTRSEARCLVPPPLLS